MVETEDVPVCLRHAREEIIMALSASNAIEADLHHKLADKYVRQAMQDLLREPKRRHDWELLREPH